MRPDPLTPAYGMARGLCLGACLWAPVIVLLGICVMAGSSVSHRIAADHSEAFSSFRAANGGQP